MPKGKIYDLREMDLFRRRIPYPKRSVEFIALIAVSCTFFLFMHTKNLNSRLHEMEIKMQPSELSALGLVSTNEIINDNSKQHELKGLHSTYQFLKSTGQLKKLNSIDLNNTKNAEIDIIIFNRVPKVGSQTMMELMKRLAMLNEFTYAKDTINQYENILYNKNEQKNLIDEIIELDEPAAFAKHIAYINFTEFYLPKPIYINLIRDPIERLISWFYYVRAPWYIIDRINKFPNLELPNIDWLKKTFETCIRNNDKECQYEQESMELGGDHRRQALFFCGQNKLDCLPFNSKTVVQIAKATVEKEYAVVGSWEDTNITLTVLENYLPKFFKGAKTVYNYKKEIHDTNVNSFKQPVSEEIKNILRKNLTNEIEFYQFCKQRLYKQYLALILDKKIKF